MLFEFYRSSNMIYKYSNETFEYFIVYMKYSSLTSFENSFQFSFCMNVIFMVRCFSVLK